LKWPFSTIPRPPIIIHVPRRTQISENSNKLLQVFWLYLAYIGCVWIALLFGPAPRCADFTHAIGEDNSGAVPSEFKLRCKYRRALAYFELQKYDDVVKDTNSILHSDPNSVQARALLGRALKVLSDYKKAEEQLSVAILLDVTQANLYIGTYSFASYLW
jgi:tetratricopeptide (TPR) repeat protein